MSKVKFTGVICPMITPFRFDGSVYREGIKNLIGFLSEKNVKGLFICGTFGLGPALTIEERKKVVEYVMDSMNKSLDVIAHVGSTSLEYSLELAKHAEDSGVDAVASTPPFYYRYDEESILTFFQQLISQVSIPIFIYNIPSRVGYDISVSLLEKLVEIGILGMKDSGNDILKSYEYIYTAKGKNRDFKFLIGTEALMLPAIIAGADGCVSGLSNIYPEAVVKLYNCLKDGKVSEILDFYFKIVRARKVMESTQSIQLCYEILKLRGIDVGYPKPLFKKVSAQAAEEAKKKIEDIGLLEDT
ncbi:MAG: dihydrodipicolinate synthase family protein [Thaumarchaeota archaeon]|jgi:N-acetylneuraminate lyase/4-hydroxy-tetrahydrodipicolinate synthase|nr:dihydrodipicolinate synthase family protein [Candidatus Geocrenenecus arthurdayi]